MAKVLVEITCVCLFIFMLARLTLNSLNFASCGVCAANGYIVEVCGNSSILPQRASDAVNAVGALFESINSAVLILIILSWKKFHNLKFLISLPLTGQTYIWFALVLLQSIAAMYTDLVHKGTYKMLLGVSTVIEIILTANLASAISHISRRMIKAWINQVFGTKYFFNRFLIILYDVMLLSYVFRHLGLFLYDTALVARSVSLSNAKSNAKKDWTSFLLVMSVALRGSFARFFFTKFFKDRNWDTVCGDNDNDNPQVIMENDGQNDVVTTTPNARISNAQEGSGSQTRYRNLRTS
ncbi:uncharacterized protein LOC130657288 [Hydractinia symbiolongicarpus]|uniref:uncharacterized protein LOC130657288 n=1 Tax=Hydractinia symbiolongicarpus TaxID=13093 RepID=UPI00255062A9|nr:uncharacterized protein LOC130657288 [Hydractinia symbiolongicarpus]